jgi:hypothetical protein
MSEPDAKMEMQQMVMKEGKMEESEASLTLLLLNSSLPGKAKPTFGGWMLKLG